MLKCYFEKVIENTLIGDTYKKNPPVKQGKT